jgi:hypothetical protein
MQPMLGIVGAALAVSVCFVPAAQGQYYGQPPGGGYQPSGGPPPQRTVVHRYGLFVGGGLGLGSLSFEDLNGNETSEGAGSLHGNIGFQFTPRFALLLDGWLMGRQDNAYDTVIQTVSTIAGQLSFTPQLYGRLGLGFAQFQIQDAYGFAEAYTDPVSALMLGGGFEVIHTPTFSLDIELRVGTGFYDDGKLTNFALAASINWHQIAYGGPPAY